jgi:hypothetical protein
VLLPAESFQSHCAGSPLTAIAFNMASPEPQSGRVSFHPTVVFDRPQTAWHRPKSSRMTTDTFRVFQSPDIPESVLVQAAQLFSDHYGICDTPAGRSGGKQGTVSFNILWTLANIVIVHQVPVLN